MLKSSLIDMRPFVEPISGEGTDDETSPLERGSSLTALLGKAWTCILLGLVGQTNELT